jgi:hypothetical protein
VRLLKIVLIICILFSIPNQIALANRCFMLENDGIPEQLQRAIAVFSGRVIAQEYKPLTTLTRGQVDGTKVLVVKLAVAEWWKGDLGEEVEMYTSVVKYPDGSTTFYAEDFNFELGKEYLVFASGLMEQLRTDICQGTKKIEFAEKDIKELGEGKLPKKKPNK